MSGGQPARPIPLFASLLVAGAVAIMITLGLWQLGRLREKEALLAHYARAEASPAEVRFPVGTPGQALLYRHSRLTCDKVLSASFVSGRNRAGDPGLARLVRCAVPGASRRNACVA